MKRIWKNTMPALLAAAGLLVMSATGNVTAESTAVSTVAVAQMGEAFDLDPSMQCVGTTDTLSMYANLSDGTFAVRTAEGKLWYSNPVDREQEAVATGMAKNLLNAQMYLTYYNKKSQSKDMDSYNDCVLNEGLTVTPCENGISVKYVFGQNTVSYEMLPTVFFDARFSNEILSEATDETTIKYLKRFYTLLDPQEMSDEEYQEALKDYPTLADGNLRVLSDVAPVYAIRNLYDFFQKIGFTDEDIKAENKRHNVTLTVEEPLRFTVVATYTVEDGELIAQVSCADIHSPSEYKLTELSLLPFFGAAGSTDTGYCFIPDGSGALVYHNNSKSEYSISLPIYGQDIAKTDYVDNTSVKQATMPVFGLMKNEQSFLCVMESAGELATLHVRNSGDQNSYNYIYPTYCVLPHDSLSLEGNSEAFNIYQNQPYNGKIVQRYFLLDSEENGYVGMAHRYQSYLEDNGTLIRLKEDGYSFLMETIGAFRKAKNFLGIPYTGTVALTTYPQTGELAGLLQEKGVKDLTVKLSAWYGKGLQPGYAASVRPIGALGGKKGFMSLQTLLKEKQIKTYLGMTVSAVNEPMLSFIYNSRKQSVRYINKEITILYPKNVATGESVGDMGYYLLSPSYLRTTLDKNTKAVRKISELSLFYEDLGDTLYSDYHTSKLSDRPQAAKLVTEALASRKETYGLSGGNVYTLSGASLITDVEMSSSRYFLEDEAVPFVQMVLHGYVDYTGPAMNRQSDVRTSFLKSLETGSLLYYVFSYQNVEQLKDTVFSDYSTSFYQNWLDEAAKQYTELSETLAPLRSVRITDHQQIKQDELVAVTYENGTVIVINYTQQPLTYETGTVPAGGYLVLKGGDVR